MPSRGQIHSGGSIDTGPATTPVTKPSSTDKLVAAAPVRPCSHTSSLSSGIATFVIGGMRGAAAAHAHAATWPAASRAAFQFQANSSWSCLGATRDDALEHVAQIGLRIEPVEF